jgi:hypothetical protein|tara:strand:+ start:3450 stop:4337 length:888 start_codon:yes stop_codon:yes gene_type:complete
MWDKKGIIISPDQSKWWNHTHGMLPTPIHVKNNLYKIYYSGRDVNNISHIGYSLVEIKNNSIVELSKAVDPVLSPGERGCFDDNGVTPSCIIDNKLYYIGWNSGTTTYRMSLIMGLATEINQKFIRNSRAPLFNKTDKEPFGILTAPYVIKDKEIYKMWYVSGEGWINKDLPKYNIKYAESLDGFNWKREAHVAIDLLENETALARPCVIKSDIYEMYFSYKDPKIGYRIGYATSIDGLTWERHNNHNHNLDTSSSGWDSEMVEYSFVFEHEGARYMLYNGNDYGKNGIGYAVWK